MKHYCITGGIGSGKSYVCKILKEQGIDIYDSDTEARRLIDSSDEIRRQLTELIGPDTYIDGRYNTAYVTSFLLASEENKQAINAIVHPAVMKDFYSSGMQWIECAIIYEAHLEHWVDKVIAVTAPAEVRVKRIMQRDNISEERATQWVNGQTSQDEVSQRADYVVVNDGVADIKKQLETVFATVFPLQVNKNNKTMNKTILAISGKPGLYELVSRAKNSLIVEALDDTHKRVPAFASDRVTSLADICMYTEEEDLPLMNIMMALRDMENSQKASLNWRKAGAKELQDYFAKFVPNFDRDRVHNSDIKKLLQWYDILVAAGITNFEEVLKPTNGDNVEDREEAEETAE